MLKNGFVHLCLILISILFALCLLELGLRFTKDEFRLRDFRVSSSAGSFAARDAAGNSLFRYDSELGWSPTPGFETATTRILPPGMRANGPAETEPAGEETKTILVVGDSFAFGDEVADAETWPAALERKTGHRVLNGGVNGYGLDQIYLRAQRLVDRFNPDLLVFSFFTDDINRCGLSYRGAHKPYFTLDQGRLRLRNTPVPGKEVEPDRERGWRDRLAYSLLFHELMMRVDGEAWLRSELHLSQIETGQDADQIARVVLQELLAFCREKGLALAVVVQYNEFHPDTIALVNAVTADLRGRPDVILVDTRWELWRLKNSDFEQFKTLYFINEVDGKLFASHMTAKGNAYVADLIQKKVADRY